MKVYDIAGVLYTQVTPAKTLFHSTMIHEVVNRGDCFMVEVRSGKLTVLSGELVRKANWFTVALFPTSNVELDTAGVIAKMKPIKPKTDTVLVKRMKADIEKARKLLDDTQVKLEGL